MTHIDVSKKFYRLNPYRILITKHAIFVHENIIDNINFHVTAHDYILIQNAPKK